LNPHALKHHPLKMACLPVSPPGYIITNVTETQKKSHKKRKLKSFLFCDPAGARTQDPHIKSVMLYQLSYGIGNKPIITTYMKKNREKLLSLL
jgi:hypothetical protein